MSAPDPVTATEPHDLEAAVDAVIAACDGDMRAAVRSMLVANNFLETKVGQLTRAVSFGFTRGKGPAARQASETLDGWREISSAADGKLECTDGTAAESRGPK